MAASIGRSLKLLRLSNKCCFYPIRTKIIPPRPLVPEPVWRREKEEILDTENVKSLEERLAGCSLQHFYFLPVFSDINTLISVL